MIYIFSYFLFTGRNLDPMEQSPKSNDVGPSNDVGVLCTRAMNNSEPGEKDEFMRVFYWGRQVFALMLGVVYGNVQLKGAAPFLLFMGINIGIVYIYAVKSQAKNNINFINTWELVKNGLITSSIAFTVVWILIYKFSQSDFLFMTYKRAKY